MMMAKRLVRLLEKRWRKGEKTKNFGVNPERKGKGGYLVILDQYPP